MKALSSLFVTIIYAIVLGVACFLINAVETSLKANGVAEIFAWIIGVAYFLYVWRDNYKKLG